MADQLDQGTCRFAQQSARATGTLIYQPIRKRAEILNDIYPSISDSSSRLNLTVGDARKEVFIAPDNKLLRPALFSAGEIAAQKLLNHLYASGF